MRALAVIGANFGDEGKGLVVDWLCSQAAEKGIVVRYNGGAQAGHTVVEPGPNGRRHVFSHFGSGSFLGWPTYFSEYFVLNPIQFFAERAQLWAKDCFPVTYAHPGCKVTTFADMMINQTRENGRGFARHGSVGLGIHETMVRSQVPELNITMSDLWAGGHTLRTKMEQICDRWHLFRTKLPLSLPYGVEVEQAIEHFIKGCTQFADAVAPLGIQDCKNPIFEGAQGLLLDQDNKEYFPHLTHSKTGLYNVAKLCHQASIGPNAITPYYVTRSYLTRHGAGKLEGEDANMQFPDETNVENPYQGKLRFAPLDTHDLQLRVVADAIYYGCMGQMELVITHLDQLQVELRDCFGSWGPTRSDVRSSKTGIKAV